MLQELCDCPCHHQSGVQHIIGCCKECPRCGQRIKLEFFDSHVKNCRQATVYNLDGENWHIDNVKAVVAEKTIRDVRSLEEKSREFFTKNFSIIPLESNTKVANNGIDFPKTREVRVSFELNYPIKKIAILRKAYYDPEEKILIERKAGEVVAIPRNANKYNLGASCDPEFTGELSSSSLAVGILSKPIPGHLLIDKSVCWISAGDPGTVTFMLENIDQHLGKGEIANMLKTVQERIDEIFLGLFESKECIKK